MRCISVKIFILAILIVLNIQISGFAQEDGEDIVRVIGKYRKIHSKILNEDRMVFVYTPDDYNVSLKKYPVLYMFDAENRVRLSGSITAVEFFNQQGQIPKIVIVGIFNTNRIRDLSPRPYKGIKNSGEGDKFLNFLTEELVPFIDKNYRTTTNRILFGGSAAGSFAIYTMISRPGFFNAFISGSPFLASVPGYEWDTESIFLKVKKVMRESKSFNKFLYMNYGSTENKEYYEKPINRLVSIIKKNAPKDFRWELRIMEGEGHVPPTSLYDGILALFSDWKLPKGSLSDIGNEKINNHLKKLSKKHGYHIGIEDILSENKINRLGYEFLRKDKFKEAIKLFKLNVMIYPGSWNAYDSLGELYMKTGENVLAVKNYKKSLKINPKNINGIKMLKKLESDK